MGWVEVLATPMQHFRVDVDSDVLPGEARIQVTEIAQMMREASTSAADVHDRGIETHGASTHVIQPEGLGDV